MKNPVFLITLLSLMTAYSYAQEMKTIFGRDSAGQTTFGGYGAPLLKAAQIRDDWGLLVGGKGGVVINRKVVFGIVGWGLVTQHEFTGDDLSGNAGAPLRLSFGAGGVFFEYVFNIQNAIHFSIPLNIMAGGVGIKTEDKERNDEGDEGDKKYKTIEKTSIFLIEPGLNVEFNFWKHFIPTLSITYRQAIGGKSLSNFENSDISGLNIGLVLKFGKFF